MDFLPPAEYENNIELHEVFTDSSMSTFIRVTHRSWFSLAVGIELSMKTDRLRVSILGISNS